MRTLTRLAALLVGIAIFAFALLAVNQSPVALKFLIWQTPVVSLYWWLLLAFVAGLLLGAASAGLSILRLRRRLRLLERAAAQPSVGDGGNADRGVADRGVADRGVADRGVADRGIADQGTAPTSAR